jgi:hypothetical protein
VPETVNYNVWAEPSRRSFVRKAGSDFGWDWGPAFATTGMAGRAYLELAAPAPTLEDIDVDVQFGASDSTAATVTVRVFVARPSVALDSVSFSVFLNGEQQVSLTRSIGTDWTSEKPVQVSYVDRCADADEISANSLYRSCWWQVRGQQPDAVVAQRIWRAVPLRLARERPARDRRGLHLASPRLPARGARRG